MRCSLLHMQQKFTLLHLHCISQRRKIHSCFMLLKTKIKVHASNWRRSCISGLLIFWFLTSIGPGPRLN